MKKSIIAAFALLSAGSALAEQFRVVYPLTDDDNGATAYLVNWDTNAKIDSVEVDGGSAVFTGNIDEPVVARILVDGNRSPRFIVEGGSIAFNKEGQAFGSMLNDQLRAASDALDAIAAPFQTATTDEQKQAIYNSYYAAVDSLVEANADNTLGYIFFFESNASQQSSDSLRKVYAKYPDIARGTRAKNLLSQADKRESTSEGHKFVDFEVTYDGRTERLSDYVGKGKYTLVDFWASWCGPCIRQVAVLKDLYKQYGDKGLQVLGVAVWDEPAATLRGIESHGIPWHNIINAQSIPTDLYGITGIPCIILFGPDGTILSRGLQDDDLRASVAKAME